MHKHKMSAENLMLNKDVCLTGTNLLLVPYLSHHVTRYHDWLSREEILEATCSEKQSLAEEFENQISWMEADDKMTFIILAPLSVAVSDVEDRKKLVEATSKGLDVFGKGLVQSKTTTSSEVVPAPSSILTSSTATNKENEYNPMVMIGDCNLFKMPIHHTEEGEIEVSVMLAENRFRGKGLAREAVGLLMSFAYDKLSRSSFVAKILASNEGSTNLFGKGSLGFEILKEVKAFDEIHYIKRLEPRLNPEDGSLMSPCTAEVPPAEKEKEEASEDTTTTKKKPLILTIEHLKASVSYVKHPYSPEACEYERTMALTNASEEDYYAETQ